VKPMIHAEIKQFKNSVVFSSKVDDAFIRGAMAK